MCGRNASRARRRHSGRVFPPHLEPRTPAYRAPGRHTGRPRRMACPRVVALRLSAGFQLWTFAGFQKWTVCFGEDSGIGFRERSSGAPTPAPMPPPEPRPSPLRRQPGPPPVPKPLLPRTSCPRVRVADQCLASVWAWPPRRRAGPRGRRRWSGRAERGRRPGGGARRPSAAQRAPLGCTNRASRALAGTRRIRSWRKDGRPGEAAGGPAALAARLAPAPGAQSSPRRSALGARRSALGARRSALGARRSALGARRSALRDSATPRGELYYSQRPQRPGKDRNPKPSATSCWRRSGWAFVPPRTRIVAAARGRVAGSREKLKARKGLCKLNKARYFYAIFLLFQLPLISL